MSQKLINKNSETIFMIELDYGELGQIVNHSDYAGIIVTRAYREFVSVYSPYKEHPAFENSWNDVAAKKLEVTKLSRDMQVVLSNE